jgi:hypothetical protein
MQVLLFNGQNAGDTSYFYQTYTAPIAPSGSKTIVTYIRFASSSTDHTALVAELNAAWSSANPQILNWSNRNPIAQLFLNTTCPGGSCSTSTTNPQGYFNNAAIDNSNQTAFNAAVDSYVSGVLTVLSNAATVMGKTPQGFIIWDLEGDEGIGGAGNPGGNPITYIGDPRLLQTMSPAMWSATGSGGTGTDHVFAPLKAAGYKVGLALRGSNVNITSGSTTLGGSCTYNNVFPGNADALAAFNPSTFAAGSPVLNRIFTCQQTSGSSGIWVLGGGQSHEGAPTTAPVSFTGCTPGSSSTCIQEQAINDIVSKAEFAYSTWGVTIFYVDSNGWYNDGDWSYQTWQTIENDLLTYSGGACCLFLPEHTNDLQFSAVSAYNDAHAFGFYNSSQPGTPPASGGAPGFTPAWTGYRSPYTYGFYTSFSNGGVVGNPPYSGKSGTTTASSNQVTVSDATGMGVGDYIYDLLGYIPAYSSITNVSGNTLTISANATGSSSSDTILVFNITAAQAQAEAEGVCHGDIYGFVGWYTNNDQQVLGKALQTAAGMSGCYESSGPIVTFPNGSLNLGSVEVGHSGPPTSMELENTGITTLNLSSITVTGTNASDFSVSSGTCGSTLAAGANCNLSATFSPSAIGSRSATATVIDTPNSVSGSNNLSGAGTFPAIGFSPSPVSLGTITVGMSSSPTTVTVTNTGTANLILSAGAVSITGTNSGDFSFSSDMCSSNTITPSGACTVNVTFRPTATGTRTGTLTITDNASSSPQTVSLTGTGVVVAPIVSVSPSSITFANQYVGTTGIPQTVEITNTGNAQLTITSITTSPVDFSSLDSSCSNSLAAGSSCSLKVSFDPTVGGTRTGTLAITDNAVGSPHTVALSGVGQDFSVTPTSSQSATVTPGQTASYSIILAPNSGFSQLVTFTCTGAPSQSTCALSPSSIVLNGSAAAAVTVTVTTTAASFIVQENPARGPLAKVIYRPVLLILGLLGLILLSRSQRGQRVRRLRLAYGLALLIFLCAGVMMSGCGGGGSSSTGSSSNTGTPAGTYTLVVTGTFTSGSTTLTRNSNLTLVVQ